MAMAVRLCAPWPQKKNLSWETVPGFFFCGRMDHALTSMASNIKLPLWGAKHVLVSGQLRKTEVRAIDFALPSVIQISNARHQVSETWLHFAAVEATWLAHYYQTHGLEFRKVAILEFDKSKDHRHECYVCPRGGSRPCHGVYQLEHELFKCLDFCRTTSPIPANPLKTVDCFLLRWWPTSKPWSLWASIQQRVSSRALCCSRVGNYARVHCSTRGYPSRPRLLQGIVQPTKLLWEEELLPLLPSDSMDFTWGPR